MINCATLELYGTLRTTRRSHLQSLYPTPKTYEERRVANWQRDMQRRAKRPRQVPLKVGIGSGVLFFCAVYLFARLELLWSAGLAGVSLSYLAALALLGIGALVVVQVIKACEAYAVTPTPFFVVWGIALFALVGTALTWLRGDGWALVLALVVGVISGVAIGVLLMVARRDESH